MGETLSLNWRTFTAILFSVALVAGAYVLARGVESPSLAQASAETALLQAIATRDSTGDGLPDWQKALYGIPLNSGTTDYFNLGMTDGEAVAKGLIVPRAIADIQVSTSSDQSIIVDPSLPPAPAEGTLTDAFARSFFTLYMNAKAENGGVELSTAQIDSLTSQAFDALSSLVTAAPDYKTLKDITVSGTGADALKAFAASAEAIILKNRNASDAAKDEILYLQDAVENNDTTALPHIVSIAKMYRDTAVGLATLPVPVELAAGDLALINVMMRASGIASDFARINTDPLAAMLALSQYVQVSQSLTATFAGISDVYTAANITLPVGTPGAYFLNAVNRHE
ncbi:hypothetical protein A2118_01355 [Candidatus Kaiserbacteria bacterium GWA2_50_9]|uniref:Uncharacterized protein n=1 Tax=Candidatus Kaiserbacteria bacterium GWA2_50_9 TaxID=1798474 RepID=A0A1F6BTT9_9BACT|nr:MAG: hypothetical protein A2118_01355 [Candidatus Kaiserbacteria bacterium GWA2_50_9]